MKTPASPSFKLWDFNSPNTVNDGLQRWQDALGKPRNSTQNGACSRFSASDSPVCYFSLMPSSSDLIFVPVNTSFTKFRGLFSLSKTPNSLLADEQRGISGGMGNFDVPVDLEFELSVDQDGNGMTLNCDPRMSEILKGHEALVQQCLSQQATPLEMAIELQRLTMAFVSPEKLSLICPTTFDLPRVDYYQRVIKDIEVLGWHRVQHLSSDMLSLTARVIDRAQRVHPVDMVLASDYPLTPPYCVLTLPTASKASSTSRAGSFSFNSSPGRIYGRNIHDLLEKCSVELNRFQPFLDNMQELDQNVHVLEPEKATLTETFRRFSVGRHASMAIDVDPIHPTALPSDITFCGPESVIRPLREHFHAHMLQWDPARSLLQNLLLALGLSSFPSSTTSGSSQPLANNPAHTDQQQQTECCICCAYRLNGMIPDTGCDNDQCGVAYHTSCLVDYLRSLPTARQSFDMLFGECVYCAHPIACKATSVL